MIFQSTELDHTLPEHNYNVELNAFEIGAAVTAAGIGVASLGITSTAAPTVVAIPGAVGAGLYLAGHNQRHGYLPFMGDKEQAKTQPAAQVKPVVNTQGAEVEIATL